jgi:hypothetical protein
MKQKYQASFETVNKIPDSSILPLHTTTTIIHNFLNPAIAVFLKSLQLFMLLLRCASPGCLPAAGENGLEVQD